MLSLLLFILLVFLVCFHISTHYSRRGLLINKIPGYKCYPIIGNMTLAFGVSLEGIWNLVQCFLKTYNPLFRFWIFHIPVVVVQHPDDVEVLLTSQKANEKKRGYEYFHCWLKTGLLTSNGEKYKQRRKLLTQAFHFNILSKNVKIINDHGRRLINNIQSKGEETVLSVLETFTKCTMNITVESGMGVDMDTLNVKTADVYREALHDFGRMIVFRILNPYICDWMLNSYTELGRLHKKTLKTLNDFTEKVVGERRDYYKRNQEKLHILNENFQKKGNKNQLSILDLLLASEKNGLIDDEGIKEEVNTIILGGTDTSQLVLAFTCLLLSERPEIQDQIRAEVTPVLDKNEGNVGMEELQQFVYLERCIKESLRLYPPLPIMARHTTADIDLKNYVIPSGTSIGIHVYEIHRNPNFWSDPEKFDPDRFLPEEIKKRHRFAYLPFSAGTRSCVGQKLGMMVLKSVLSQIIYNFYLEPITLSKDLRFAMDIVLHSWKPIYVKFVKINRQK